MAKIDAFLKVMRDEDASDLHLCAEGPPVLRINGALQIADHRPLTAEEVRLLVYELLTEAQIAELEESGELDCAHTIEGVARFRIHAYMKFPGLAAAFRVIPHEIPTLDALGMPKVVKELLSYRSGLILVTGPTNSGKSTTLAAMVDYLNTHMNHHILTLEDPLEFIHTNRQCMINQRQIGEHSASFSHALRGALRADPNVILVGEMRDLDTIAMALTAAELGLLVMGTLHTKSAAQTISRMVDAFPVDQQPGVRVAMSEVLLGIVSQQLLRRRDGDGRVAALEILVANQAVRTMIRDEKAHQIPNVITTGKKEGMILLDQSLRDLVTSGMVASEEAARFAQDPMAILGLEKARPNAVPAEV